MWNIRLQRYAPELLQVIQIDRLEPSVHGEQDDVSSPDVGISRQSSKVAAMREPV